MIATRSRRTGSLLLFTSLVVTVVGSGCSSLARYAAKGWVGDYDTAEKRVEKTGKELLVLFKGTSRRTHDPVDDVIADRQVKTRLRNFVRCKLFRSHEPDRRFVGQYGVQRAPAWILIHRDGSYHARTGLLSAQDLLSFLDDAQGAGLEPVASRLIPRRTRYQWHRDVDAARRLASEADKPALYVFHRWWSRDLRRLKTLLRCQEVHSRCRTMIACRVTSLWPAGKALAAELGVTQWPAMAIVYPDGVTTVLELPTSVDQVALFAAAGGRDDGASAALPTSDAAGP